jgi:hypothetical protein
MLLADKALGLSPTVFRAESPVSALARKSVSREQEWKVEAFAGQIKTAKAEVDLIYAGKGRWTASSTGPAGELSLATPGGDSWPRLERLMRVLVGVGIVQANLKYRGLPPAFATESSAIATRSGSASEPSHYAKVVAFSERARSPRTIVHLVFGRDGLWYVYAAAPDGRHVLKPNYGEGWGRLEGLLQTLAGAGLTEARITFEGMPPASVVVDSP